MILSALAFHYQRFGLFALVATAAVLLKETALTIPLSALLLVGCWHGLRHEDRLRNPALLVLPLVIWGVLKLWVFQHGFLSAVLISERHSSLIQPIRNALLWPTGLYVGPLSLTRHLVSAHEWSSLATQAVQSLVNCLWWAVLLCAGALAYNEFAQRGSKPRPDPWVLFLFFAVGNLALVLSLQSSQLRFGYFWYAVGPVALFAVLSKWRAGAWVAVLMTAGLVIPQILTISRALSSESLDYYREVKASARQMTELLHDLPASVHKVYVIDDLFVKPISPIYLARFSGFRGDVVLINSLDPIPGCTPAAERTVRYGLHRSGAATVLDYRAPPLCLQWVWTNAPVTSPTNGAEVPRGKWLTYRFPEFRTTEDPNLPGGQRFDIGQSWSVRETDPVCAQAGACLWLGFDGVAERYFPVPSNLESPQ
jgi:hypothetical protein